MPETVEKAASVPLRRAQYLKGLREAGYISQAEGKTRAITIVGGEAAGRKDQVPLVGYCRKSRFCSAAPCSVPPDHRHHPAQDGAALPVDGLVLRAGVLRVEPDVAVPLPAEGFHGGLVLKEGHHNVPVPGLGLLVRRSWPF